MLNTLYAESHLGAVTSPHHLATQAGQAVLAQGGNAIEAAIAVGSVLTVVYPHMNSIGGDAFFLLSDHNGKITAIDGAGPALGGHATARDDCLGFGLQTKTIACR